MELRLMIWTMGRYPQSRGERGSQKWIQRLINEHPELLNRKIMDSLNLAAEEKITWLSPLEKDKYAEYRDQEFLDLIGVELKNVPLEAFWPRGGPQWDGLGSSNLGKLFLIEAKSHVGELISTLKAEDKNSQTRIKKSLDDTKRFLNSRTDTDWSLGFYQYTNRLSHLYLLRELNHLPAYLVFVYFMNDAEMGGPKTADEWEGAIELMRSYLGIGRHRLQKSVLSVFIDVRDLN